MFSQWISDSVKLGERLKDLKINEPNELYHSSTGSICSCDLLYKNCDTSEYIVSYFFKEDNQNILFFRVKFKDGREIYGSYINSERDCDGDKIFCWVQDLIWYYLNPRKELQKVEFYENGSMAKVILY